MLTLLCAFLFFAIFGKLAVFAFKATWGITKILLYIVFLPLIILGMIIAGLIYIAIPLLVITGIIVVFITL